MKTKFKKNALLTTALVSSLFSANLLAKVINVHPGLDTLQAAIDGAEAGDVLVLQPGTYSDSGHVELEKELTIRAASRDSKPVIALASNHSFRMGSTDCNRPIGVTIQGIKLLSSTGHTKTTLSDKGCMTEINLFENEFVNTHIRLENSGRNAKHRVVGNTLVNGYIYTSYNNLSYIAANTVTGSINISSAQSAYVVGNRVDCRSTERYHESVMRNGEFYENNKVCSGIRIDSPTRSYVIANDISLQLDTDNDQQNGYKLGIYLKGGAQLATSNVVKVNKIGTLDWINQPSFISGIFADNGGVYDIFNNIIDLDEGLPNTEKSAIFAQTNVVGHIQNNIVVNHPNAAISATPDLVQIASNLCHNNVIDCDEAEGNLSTAPQFENFYQLASGSPAIDTGYDVLARSDLDGTRADMGIHGGPFGYDQYANQRNDVANPFIFPLFDDIDATDAESVAVRVLAISRLK